MSRYSQSWILQHHAGKGMVQRQQKPPCSRATKVSSVNQRAFCPLDAGKTEQGPHPAVQLCIWRWLGRGLRGANGDSELTPNTGQRRDTAGMGHGGFVLLAQLL